MAQNTSTMTNIKQIDVDGSQNDFLSIYNVEVETDDTTYFFAFEGSFYSCQRRNDRETVETGTESGLEDMSEESVRQFCMEKVDEYEEKRR